MTNDRVVIIRAACFAVIVTLKSAAENRDKPGVKENPQAGILKMVTAGMARWRIDPGRMLWNNLPVKELRTRLILESFLFLVVFLRYASLPTSCGSIFVLERGL